MARALVLGGYGLIGSACLRALAASGFEVTGVGRSAAAARRVAPDAAWIILDIAELTAEGWRRLLAGVDVVVNAAGALQDGPRDDLAAIHEVSAGRMAAAAAETRTRIVQISAAGVSESASTGFFRTKARGDAAIRGSGAEWIILRPTLVIGPGAYGGSALLRAAAAVPFVAFDVLPGSQVQTVALDDVARAVVRAASGAVPPGTVADLTGPAGRSLPETVDALRRWLGFRAPAVRVPVPRPALAAVARCADGLGRLGWRSPPRSTAIRALEDGVRGDPAAWAAAGGPACRALGESLAAMPATVQERWFARLYLAFPVMVLLLAVFWGVSGAVGLAQFEAARDVLVLRGVSEGLAGAAVAGGAAVDLALAAAILWRPWTRAACGAMALVSLGYLAGGTVLTPGLWADPLGPFVKVLPGLGLALVTMVMAGDR